MFNRKIYSVLEKYFEHGSERVLILDGARQIGKSYAPLLRLGCRPI